jgi:hypothetical protein
MTGKALTLRDFGLRVPTNASNCSRGWDPSEEILT